MICKIVDKWGQEREINIRPEELDPTSLKSVQMSGTEWATLQAVINQLRSPWVRNANKDRGIRPARSSSGYVILAAKAVKISGQEAYRITVETPYRLDAFDPEAARELLVRDAKGLALELGYNEYHSTYRSYGSCLCCGRLDIDYTRNEYYHAVFESAKLPKIVYQKK